MYIASWDDFSQRARSLYLAEPMRTRYCIRYDHSASRLVVKVTDDVKARCCTIQACHRARCSVKAASLPRLEWPCPIARMPDNSITSKHNELEFTMCWRPGRDRIVRHPLSCALLASGFATMVNSMRVNLQSKRAAAVQVLQFKTDQHADAKKLDELNAFFLSLMAGANVADAAAAAPGQRPAADANVPQKRPKRRN